MNITIKDLSIDPASLGKTLLMTGATPWYLYENGKKTNQMLGHKVLVASKEHGLRTLAVKVPGELSVEESDDFPLVKFKGLKINAMVINGKEVISATADSVELMDVPAAKK